MQRGDSRQNDTNTVTSRTLSQVRAMAEPEEVKGVETGGGRIKSQEFSKRVVRFRPCIDLHEGKVGCSRVGKYGTFY